MMDSVDDFVEVYQGFIVASYSSAKKAEAERLSHEVLDMGYEIADILESQGMHGVRGEIEEAVEHILSGMPNLIQSGGEVLGKWAGSYKTLYDE